MLLELVVEGLLLCSYKKNNLLYENNLCLFVAYDFDNSRVICYPAL